MFATIGGRSSQQVLKGGSKFNGSRSSMEWKLNGSVASRGSRGSPEVGNRRVNDTNISRVFLFYLFALGMPVTSQLRKHDAASLRHAAIVWVSDIYAASIAGIFQSSCCCFVRITAMNPGNSNGSVDRGTNGFPTIRLHCFW